jgi:OPA family glycerol-3-phosphate transporter-like MFS transporter
MGLILFAICLLIVVWLYFHHNPMDHSGPFIFRRFVNWFPLGMSYAFLYMGRYNLNVCKNALGSAITKEDFGWIFGIGTFVYGVSLLINGPLVDKIGGKRGIIIASLGAALANGALGLVTYLFQHGRFQSGLVLTLMVVYSINMFFQSYGAVSIIKVKAYWFHVRERGLFGAIFGTLISFGSLFAFDWGQAIVDASQAHLSGPPTAFQKFFRAALALDQSSLDAVWLVFWIPAVIMVAWALIDMVLIKDYPSQAGFEDFDTHDASSGEMDREFTIWELIQRVLTSRLMLIFAVVEFCAGVIRNGVMQWYFIFAKELPQGSSAFFLSNWGILICMVGIAGGFAGGFISDSFFNSRRGPPAALAQGLIFMASVLMAAVLFTSPTLVGVCALVMFGAVITVHSLLSGTAAADFGGRKATASASGILDGFVYLGSGLQSVCLGYLTSKDWHLWPLFLSPFALLGLFLAVKIWRELPEATKRYLAQQESTKAKTSPRSLYSEA